MTTDSLTTEFWACLIQTSKVSFNSKSKVGNSGWNGTGSGVVKVETVDNQTIRFLEKGTWVTQAGVKMDYSNEYKWSFENPFNTITLEHLRYGKENPVSLLKLERGNDHSWKTIKPHICNDDRYSLEINYLNQSMIMNWTVIGPKKNEFIRYQYC